MTKNEFIDKIDNGDDIMFDVSGRHFTILTFYDEGIGIGEQYPHESKISFFPNASELIDNFKIGDNSLSKVLNEITITSYTRVTE